MRSGASRAGQKAEVAMLIDDEFQGLGIAPRIFKHLVAIARASGIMHFKAEVLPSNEPMLKVFARAGVSAETTPADRYVYVLIDLTGGGDAPSGGVACATVYVCVACQCEEAYYIRKAAWHFSWLIQVV